jgi:hypothetical protein
VVTVFHVYSRRKQLKKYENYIEINEGGDNRDNDFCLPLAKYGGLDKDRKISLL